MRVEAGADRSIDNHDLFPQSLQKFLTSTMTHYHSLFHDFGSMRQEEQR